MAGQPGRTRRPGSPIAGGLRPGHLPVVYQSRSGVPDAPEHARPTLVRACRVRREHTAEAVAENGDATTVTWTEISRMRVAQGASSYCASYQHWLCRGRAGHWARHGKRDCVCSCHRRPATAETGVIAAPGVAHGQ